MSWQKEYLGALQVRDSKEQATKDIYNLYTNLADRTARLQQAPPPLEASPVKKDKLSRPDAQSLNAATTTTAKLREDLVDAQRSRGELQARLTAVTSELEALQVRSKGERKRISELAAEKNSLAVKLRDRDEELRGKAKLLEDVHDETVSLTLQLNMAEKQNAELQVENKELVDRWMARMGQEAEAMNTASRFS